jgi:hypothetical protein
MRKISLLLLGLSAIVALASGPEAHAIHGCVSVGGVVNITSGDGGPVHQEEVCNFTMVEGDTYTALGPYSFRCPKPGGPGFNTGTHAATDPPVVYTALDCRAGGIVEFTLEQGGVVAAGSPLT